jgi:hypothetical protein
MLFARTPEQGAETIIHLAASPQVATASGGYYVDCRPAAPSRVAQDDAAAGRLWEESARIAGLSLGRG